MLTDDGRKLPLMEAMREFGAEAQKVLSAGNPVPESELKLNKELPELLRGETWAKTMDLVFPEDVVDDAYCIENNWESRGDYYIIDVVSQGFRLVHSDKLGINERY